MILVCWGFSFWVDEGLLLGWKFQGLRNAKTPPFC